MIRVSVFNAHPRRRIRRSGVERTVRHVMAGEHRRTADVNVVFVDGRYCSRMNRTFLRRRGETDVISFPLGEKGKLEGEVYVNLDRAREQAGWFGVAEPNEITRLVVHGTLHLLGYDDRTAALRRRMKKREDVYVEDLASSGRPVENI